MIELELKAVVTDPAGLQEKLRLAGAAVEFIGRMVDRRLDFVGDSLTVCDEVLRLRKYVDAAGHAKASIDWKGPASIEAGYKRREELATSIGDADTTMTILRRLGLRVTRSIERDIRQYTLEGATVRMEHYSQMDDLVEVEGEAAAIERAIAIMGIPRSEFSADNLALFADRYSARTGRQAITGFEGDAAEPLW